MQIWRFLRKKLLHFVPNILHFVPNVLYFIFFGAFFYSDRCAEDAGLTDDAELLFILCVYPLSLRSVFLEY